jgi:hypothetical protein
MLKERVWKNIGNVVEILYNLDLALSNHYVGNPSDPNDKAIKEVRSVLAVALEALSAHRWIGKVKDIS